MNLIETGHQRLSRRLLSYYLMFGLMSIIALSLGWMVLVSSPQARVKNQGLMTRLSEMAATIASDYRSTDGLHVQSMIENSGNTPEYAHCSVISSDGVYLAHSNPELVGCKSARMLSVGSTAGVVERVRYLRSNGPGPSEYWLPLSDGQKSYGLLQVCVNDPDSNQGSAVAARHAGIAIALPLVFLIVGGIKLHGVVRSSSMIERQLEGLVNHTQGQSLSLTPVEPSGLASIGWNHLVSISKSLVDFSGLEARLAESVGGINDQKFGRILQGLTDGVASTNESGQILFANRAFAALLNADHESVTGSSIEELLAQVTSHQVDAVQRLMEHSSRPAVLELHRSGDLTDGVLRLSRVPLRSKDENALLQIWSVRDITQQKLVEFTRDQFVDTATHELRTPLTNIKACAETLELESDIDLEIQKKYLNTINMEATRLGRFVDEFLNISRMEAGSLEVTRNPVHLERLIDEAVEKLRPQMTLKQIDFQVVLPPKIPELRLDKDKISAALVNLLGNAGKYTPEGGRVTLQMELSSTEVQIHVEDTGFGIAPNEVPKVFDKFFRSDDNRVRDETGTGLGLAFAQEIVRLHGGRISVRSELNQGSRFTMSLPLA